MLFEALLFSITGNGVVIHLPGLFEEAEKNLQKGKGDVSSEYFKHVLQFLQTKGETHRGSSSCKRLYLSFCLQDCKVGRRD